MAMNRDQWVYLKPCGCPEGVAEGYLADTPEEAMGDLFDTPKDLIDAVKRGVTAKLVSWNEYDNVYYPMMSISYQCPHQEAA